MFLHYLNDAQKSALFELGNQMINADHVVAPAEVCYRDLLTREAGSSLAPASQTDKMALLDLFTDRQSCTALVVELLVLAIIDGSYHPEEEVFAQSMIDYFGFTPGDQEKMNKMAEQIAASVAGYWELVQSTSSG